MEMSKGNKFVCVKHTYMYYVCVKQYDEIWQR